MALTTSFKDIHKNTEGKIISFSFSLSSLLLFNIDFSRCIADGICP